MLSKQIKSEIRREYFRYLIPTIIGQTAYCCYCLADVFFVGKGVGSDGLAALNVALPIFTIYSTFSILIGVGAATTISVCRGRHEYDECDRVFTMAILSVLAIGLLLSVVFTVFLRDIAYLFGATDRIVQYVVDYLRPITPLAFVHLMSNALSVIVRADGNPRLVMAAGTAGNLANIVLDYLFVMPLDMGIFGAGLATIIGPCITCAMLLFHFIRRYSHLRFLRRGAFSFPLLWRMAKNGVGSGVLETSSGFVILMFNLVLIREGGEDAVAIFSLISNIGYVGKGIFNGIAQAAQPIISISYGRQEFGRMNAVNRYAMATALVFSLGVYGLVVLFPSQIIHFFLPQNGAAASLGTLAIVLYFISLPFTGLNTVLMYDFQSVERAGHTLVMAVLRGILLIYAALTLFSILWGLVGIWLSLAAAEALTFVVFYPIKIFGDRKRATTPSQKDT